MKVTLAREWTDPKGKAHKADTTVDVDEVTGRDLLFQGVAREEGVKSDG